MTSLGWALIQYDWYPYRKRKLDTLCLCRVKTGEDGYLQVKERDLRRNQSCLHLDFGL